MTEKQKNLRLVGPVYAIFFLIYLVACIIEPTFFTWDNNVNLFTRITPLIIVGIAQTLVILTGAKAESLWLFTARLKPRPFKANSAAEAAPLQS